MLDGVIFWIEGIFKNGLKHFFKKQRIIKSLIRTAIYFKSSFEQMDAYFDEQFSINQMDPVQNLDINFSKLFIIQSQISREDQKISNCVQLSSFFFNKILYTYAYILLKQENPVVTSQMIMNSLKNEGFFESILNFLKPYMNLIMGLTFSCFSFDYSNIENDIYDNCDNLF